MFFNFDGRVHPETALEWSQTMTADELQEIVSSDKRRYDAQFWPLIGYFALTFALMASVFLTGPLGVSKSWGIVSIIAAAFALGRGIRPLQRENDRTATAAHALKIQRAVPKRSASDAE